MLPSLSLLQIVVLPVALTREVDRAGRRQRAMALLDMAGHAIFALVPWADSTRVLVASESQTQKKTSPDYRRGLLLIRKRFI